MCNPQAAILRILAFHCYNSRDNVLRRTFGPGTTAYFRCVEQMVFALYKGMVAI